MMLEKKSPGAAPRSTFSALGGLLGETYEQLACEAEGINVARGAPGLVPLDAAPTTNKV